MDWKKIDDLVDGFKFSSDNPTKEFTYVTMEEIPDGLLQRSYCHLGDFTFGEEIGSGAYGSVREACKLGDSSCNHVVKIIYLESKIDVANFWIEVELLRKGSSRWGPGVHNAVTCKDKVGRNIGIIVMERLGIDFTEIQIKNDEFGLWLLNQVKTAVDAMHEDNIFHSDLYDRNLMLTAKGDKVVVIDLGMSLLFDKLPSFCKLLDWTSLAYGLWSPDHSDYRGGLGKLLQANIHHFLPEDMVARYDMRLDALKAKCNVNASIDDYGMPHQLYEASGQDDKGKFVVYMDTSIHYRYLPGDWPQKYLIHRIPNVIRSAPGGSAFPPSFFRKAFLRKYSQNNYALASIYVLHMFVMGFFPMKKFYDNSFQRDDYLAGGALPSFREFQKKFCEADADIVSFTLDKEASAGLSAAELKAFTALIKRKTPSSHLKIEKQGLNLVFIARMPTKAELMMYYRTYPRFTKSVLNIFISASTIPTLEESEHMVDFNIVNITDEHKAIGTIGDFITKYEALPTVTFKYFFVNQDALRVGLHATEQQIRDKFDFYFYFNELNAQSSGRLKFEMKFIDGNDPANASKDYDIPILFLVDESPVIDFEIDQQTIINQMKRERKIITDKQLEELIIIIVRPLFTYDKLRPFSRVQPDKKRKYLFAAYDRDDNQVFCPPFAKEETLNQLFNFVISESKTASVAFETTKAQQPTVTSTKLPKVTALYYLIETDVDPTPFLDRLRKKLIQDEVCDMEFFNAADGEKRKYHLRFAICVTISPTRVDWDHYLGELEKAKFPDKGIGIMLLIRGWSSQEIRRWTADDEFKAKLWDDYKTVGPYFVSQKSSDELEATHDIDRKSIKGISEVLKLFRKQSHSVSSSSSASSRSASSSRPSLDPTSSSWARRQTSYKMPESIVPPKVISLSALRPTSPSEPKYLPIKVFDVDSIRGIGQVFKNVESEQQGIKFIQHAQDTSEMSNLVAVVIVKGSDYIPKLLENIIKKHKLESTSLILIRFGGNRLTFDQIYRYNVVQEIEISEEEYQRTLSQKLTEYFKGLGMFSKTSPKTMYVRYFNKSTKLPNPKKFLRFVFFNLMLRKIVNCDVYDGDKEEQESKPHDITLFFFDDDQTKYKEERKQEASFVMSKYGGIPQSDIKFAFPVDGVGNPKRHRWYSPKRDVIQLLIDPSSKDVDIVSRMNAEIAITETLIEKLKSLT